MQVSKIEKNSQILAAILGALAIIGSFLIGWTTLDRTSEAIEIQIEYLSLTKVQSLASLSFPDHGISDSLLIRRIVGAWESELARAPDEYICIFDREAKLLFHSNLPHLVGYDASHSILVDSSGSGYTNLGELIRASQTYVGVVTTKSGESQMASFAPLSKRNWTIGVHRPKSVVQHKINEDLRAQYLGVLLISFGLIPLSLGLFYAGYLRIRQKRSNIEKSLKESEEQYRALFQDLPSPLLIHDGEKILDANPATIAALGFEDKQEFIGTDVFDLIHPQDQERSRERIKLMLEENASLDSEEFTIIPKHNGERIVSATPTAVQFDNRPAIMVNYHDITSRKKAEQELFTAKEVAEENEARFKALLEASIGGIAIHDKRVILDCNPGFSHMTGFSVDELIGNDGLKLFSKKSRDTVKSNILSGYEKPYEAVGLRKDGSEYPLMIESRGIPYEGKQVRVVEFRDITEQKESEAQRKSLESQLRQSQKLEAVGTMVSGISHEFNNLLQSMFLYGNLIQDMLPENQELHDNLQHLLDDGYRARDLIKQILTFSRKSKVEMKPCSLEQIVQDILSLERISMPLNIKIEQDFSLDCSRVLCDETQMHQIIINLCNNAQHAMAGKGGTLSISLQQVLATLDKLRPGSEVVELKISDTGCGMDASTMEKIFDPFFTTKGIGEGTGLGLSVVHGIVEMMGGQISVVSELGMGSTFRILLPLLKMD